MEMAKIAPGVAGGSNRQTLTDGDGEARHLLRRWAEAEGADLTVDRIGNMFLRREGMEPDLPPVCLGSHLDTQPTGGKYDGVLGVLAGLEVFRSLNERKIATRYPIVLINWTNEEGSRFAPAMLASGAFAGLYTEEWVNARTDAAGLAFGDELDRIGWRGEKPVGEQPMKAFFELHIEQGPLLEDGGLDVGVVTHGQGLYWLEVSFEGRESHTGTTPMDRRRDAARGLAQTIELVNETAFAFLPGVVGSVGHASVEPNSRNIIPGYSVCTIDIRTADKAKLEAMRERIERGVHRIAETLGLAAKVTITGHFDPITFDLECVSAVRSAANRLGYRHADIVSCAGHDACHVNRVVPSAMVMCPCVDGLSHNEAEEITKDWAGAGANVLMHAVLETAEIVQRKDYRK
ncbi:N-carbamoyl-L-amino acid amidohydrolase [Fulvimarina pelagi HTCC2506]|uniref:N-carbamoyl-L-amino acid amidohydrolase n=2 Tax=Fulvimarina pelagi TaxID=217511 RepID=Q0FY64_9HYPH|nr:N-carbamoyl-L-amino acid amidohydrolase [Fulvimarina pelagi HTCC2506]